MQVGATSPLLQSHIGLAVLWFLACLSVPRASQSQTINEFVITQKTSTANTANTNDGFRFIVKPGGTACIRDFPNLPHNAREKGKTDTYTLNVSSCGLSLSSVSP